jgi:hypothetical protein
VTYERIDETLDRNAVGNDTEAARRDNPHIKYFDGSYRGYVRCDVTQDNWQMTFMGVPIQNVSLAVYEALAEDSAQEKPKLAELPEGPLRERLPRVCACLTQSFRSFNPSILAPPYTAPIRKGSLRSWEEGRLA